ncbi:hypothetical protein PVAR5_5397 [Paecilomyces variotii No. 5]|uniref:Uncharacterized protein n=1 Tax=Byssochlamys spectabilis (strain No. 5 / NBRC 109023) TaxID=1356009 RepID=V5G764_BYSSN|nr:hypothetical protein PVAR5_5397 [Paecilomyces variotii No. 5]
MGGCDGSILRWARLFPVRAQFGACSFVPVASSPLTVEMGGFRTHETEQDLNRGITVSSVPSSALYLSLPFLFFCCLLCAGPPGRSSSAVLATSSADRNYCATHYASCQASTYLIGTGAFPERVIGPCPVEPAAIFLAIKSRIRLAGSPGSDQGRPTGAVALSSIPRGVPPACSLLASPRLERVLLGLSLSPRARALIRAQYDVGGVLQRRDFCPDLWFL